MSDHKKEQLSEFIDGESSDSLDMILSDDEMKDTWMRYHLIGDCLRGHLPEKLSHDLSGNIKAALQDEPTVLAPGRKFKETLKPLAGFAIAASVAMLAVLGVQTGNQVEGTATAPAIAQKELNLNTQPVIDNQFRQPQVLPAAVKKSDTPESIANQRLNNYLMNHNEYRGSASIQGMLPYVRIVTIEAQE